MFLYSVSNARLSVKSDHAICQKYGVCDDLLPSLTPSIRRESGQHQRRETLSWVGGRQSGAEVDAVGREPRPPRDEARRLVAQRAVRPDGVKVDPPGLDPPPRVLQALEPVSQLDWTEFRGAGQRVLRHLRGGMGKSRLEDRIHLCSAPRAPEAQIQSLAAETLGSCRRLKDHRLEPDRVQGLRTDLRPGRGPPIREELHPLFSL